MSHKTCKEADKLIKNCGLVAKIRTDANRKLDKSRTSGKEMSYLDVTSDLYLHDFWDVR